ncbi:MAG: arginine decarboxylase, pyruvoyl-dependent [Nitrososphaeria archaeon]|jgi:arginine decarboxylase
MSTFIPTKYFLTNGVGVHRDRLASFELALRDAGIQYCNLVSVASIIPPKARHISRKEGMKLISPGQIIFVVMSKNETNEPNRLISASVGLAIPNDKSLFGYLSEFHSFGMTGEKCGEYAEDLAAYMLASTLGLEFDPDKSYDVQREQWRISGKIVKTLNITQSAEGNNKGGCWTTVFSAAVLLP